MMQKLIVGVLVLTVIGAVGIGVYDAQQTNAQATQVSVLANADGLSASSVASDPAAQAAQIAPTPTVEFIDSAATTGTTTDSVLDTTTVGIPVQEQIQAATNMVGDPWLASGTITLLDTAGMDLALPDGSTVYVELGPSHYWSELGITLSVGDVVTVQGFQNGDQYHAATVTTANGAQIVVRTAEGQPLWSGGANGGQNQNGATNGATSGQTEAQVTPDQWITVEGTVTAVNTNALTMQTTAGETLQLQLGEPSFIAQQGITFAAGDPISVLGFWQGTQFRAGDITKTATGERLMLLDPNGVPMWGGPGRAGSRSGQNGTTTGGQGQGSQGQGNQGQGGQGQGGQGQGQRTVSVPVTEWETVQGSVRLTESLALTLALSTGEEVRVSLGQTDFWSIDGTYFVYGEPLTVSGFWQNGQFEAGVVTFDDTGDQLIIRDVTGQLVYGTASQSGQGNQGQGSQGQGNSTNNSSNGGGGNGGNGNGYRGGRS